MFFSLNTYVNALKNFEETAKHVTSHIVNETLKDVGSDFRHYFEYDTRTSYVDGLFGSMKEVERWGFCNFQRVEEEVFKDFERNVVSSDIKDVANDYVGYVFNEFEKKVKAELTKKMQEFENAVISK